MQSHQLKIASLPDLAMYGPNGCPGDPEWGCQDSNIYKKEEASFETSSCEMECGGRDSNSHRITPTTPSK